MTIPAATHREHPWVMNALAADFTLLDAWAVPARGAKEDFRAFARAMLSLDPAEASSPVRALFTARHLLGGVLRLDSHENELPIPGCSETSLRDRLPQHLQGSTDDVQVGRALRASGGAFAPVYLTDTECAAELSNATVHGVLHLGWVECGNGVYEGRLAVYVRPRGLLGQAYLRFIGPFRHLLVYPELMRMAGRAWRR
jgi:hypothetical protein